MPRPLRVQFPGALYHVMSRGNARQDVFVDDVDRVRFLKILAQVVARHHLLCHAHCLMDNHFHLLLETPCVNLSRAMQELNGRYGLAHNRSLGRSATSFRGVSSRSWWRSRATCSK